MRQAAARCCSILTFLSIHILLRLVNETLTEHVLRGGSLREIRIPVLGREKGEETFFKSTKAQPRQAGFQCRQCSTSLAALLDVFCRNSKKTSSYQLTRALDCCVKGRDLDCSLFWYCHPIKYQMQQKWNFLIVMVWPSNYIIGGFSLLLLLSSTITTTTILLLFLTDCIIIIISSARACSPIPKHKRM